MKKIVQSVPNFSEGKDLEIINKIAAPFENTAGVTLLSVEPDANYNRTVVTVIGEVSAMKKAMVEAIGVATQLIDLNNHSGEHKRMGATDVVPFIPIANMTVEEATELAKECALEVSEKYNLPVYLYNLSATASNRKTLPSIRKGEFEGMKEKIKLAEWAPDYGKAEIHETAGVCAMGCRKPLIAYNIDLKTEDKDIANFIAKAIRFSSGGFRFVQAGPAKMDDFYQVTMNVTDYTKTSVYRVFETVVMEAKRFDVEVTSCEFIGLVPRACLEDIVAYYLKKADSTTLQELELSELVDLAIKHLKVRDFNINKVIEYHI